MLHARTSKQILRKHEDSLRRKSLFIREIEKNDFTFARSIFGIPVIARHVQMSDFDSSGNSSVNKTTAPCQCPHSVESGSRGTRSNFAKSARRLYSACINLSTRASRVPDQGQNVEQFSVHLRDRGPREKLEPRAYRTRARVAHVNAQLIELTTACRPACTRAFRRERSACLRRNPLSPSCNGEPM